MVDQEVNNFSSLYTNYYRRAFLFVKSYVHDELAAEDIASDVLLKMWTQLKDEQLVFSKVLLLTMLKNKALDHLKHQRVEAEAFHQITTRQQHELEFRLTTLEACDPDYILSREAELIIQQTLASLSDQTRKVFEMSRFDGKSNKEIAAELDITIKAVEYHITKSLKALRVALRDYLPFAVFCFLFIDQFC